MLALGSFVIGFEVSARKEKVVFQRTLSESEAHCVLDFRGELGVLCAESVIVRSVLNPPLGEHQEEVVPGL